jgi:uncharacterized membrane protein
VLVPGVVRHLAGWGLILLLVAVFPANVHMALHPDQIAGLTLRRCCCGCACRSSSC